MKRKRITNATLDAVQDLIHEALTTDGGHHKQWYLECIAKELGLETPSLEYREEGIAP